MLDIVVFIAGTKVLFVFVILITSMAFLRKKGKSKSANYESDIKAYLEQGNVLGAAETAYEGFLATKNENYLGVIKECLKGARKEKPEGSNIWTLGEYFGGIGKIRKIEGFLKSAAEYIETESENKGKQEFDYKEFIGDDEKKEKKKEKDEEANMYKAPLKEIEKGKGELKYTLPPEKSKKGKEKEEKK